MSYLHVSIITAVLLTDGPGTLAIQRITCTADRPETDLDRRAASDSAHEKNVSWMASEKILEGAHHHPPSRQHTRINVLAAEGNPGTLIAERNAHTVEGERQHLTSPLSVKGGPTRIEQAPGEPWRETPRSPGASLASVTMETVSASTTTAAAPGGTTEPSKTAPDGHGKNGSEDGHGEHGDGGHEKEEGEEEEPKLGEGVLEQESHAGFIAGMILFVFTVGQMGLLFLLHYPDPQVRSYSFKLFSNVISILCALMFEKSQDHLMMKKLIIPMVGFEHGLNHLWCGVPFLIAFFSIRPLCYLLQNKPNEKFAVECIVAHLAAFIAIEMFNEPLEHIARQQSAGVHLLLYINAPVVALLIFLVLSKVSAWFVTNVWKLGATGELRVLIHHGWQHSAGSAEVESSALVFGFLIKELGEQLIETVCHNDSNADEHSTGAVIAMFLYTVLVGAGYCVIVVKKEPLEKKLGEDAYEKLLDHGAMSMSWCFTSFSKWASYWSLVTTNDESILKSLTVRKMINAVWLTPAMTALIIGMDKLADAGHFDDFKAEGLISCCGLITGIAWEQCYSSAFRTIATGWPSSQCFFGFGLVAVLVPGWLKFIVPTAREPVPRRDRWADGDGDLDSVDSNPEDIHAARRRRQSSTDS